MLNKYSYSGKSLEEALEKCLADLSLESNDLYIKDVVEEGKLFKAKKCNVEAIKKEDVIAYVKNFIKEVCRLMNISINMEVRESDDIINVILVTDANAILIGKDGRTLNSIQMLLRQALNKEAGMNIKVNMDASNYKAKKMENLEREVRNISREIINTKVDVKLDPMNSYERRLVHTIVGEFEELETESVGEGMDRAVVIK